MLLIVAYGCWFAKLLSKATSEVRKETYSTLPFKNFKGVLHKTGDIWKEYTKLFFVYINMENYMSRPK